MKIALTGASGFIGRHLLSVLHTGGHQVVAVTRDRRRLIGVPGNHQIVEMDIAIPPDNAFAILGQPDILIHLAWDGLPNYQSPHHLEKEVPIHCNFIRNLVLAGLPKVLIAGTCLEYGRQYGPLSESHPAKPETPYGMAKDALRRQLEALKASHPFSLTWSRLFYMYGQGQSPSSLYSQLATAVQRGDSSFKMSMGEQLRDYLPVTEVARIIVKLALMDQASGMVNICSGKPISVRRLVESWITENGWSIRPDLGHYPYPDYEPLAFWGDATRLHSLLAAASPSPCAT